MLGYQYFNENFNFGTIGSDFGETFSSLNDTKLKSNSLSLIISKPINETQYWAVRFRYSSYGDYDSIIAFEERYSMFKFLGLYGIKPNEDFEWGFGLNFSKSFRNTNFIPFIVLIKILTNIGVLRLHFQVMLI